MSKRFSVLLALALLAVPSAARADGWVSPYIGVNFGGSTGDDLSTALDNRSRLNYGVAIGGMGGGIFGAEFDIGYTPKFFGENIIVDNSGLLVATGNILIGVPIGGQTGAGIRPYFAAGAGLLRRQVSFLGGIADIDQNDFAYTLGGGVMGFFGDHFGLRGDYRYYRNFQKDELDDFGDIFDFDLGTFNFSRASVAAVFRF